jgi:hypothetical protein
MTREALDGFAAGKGWWVRADTRVAPAPRGAGGGYDFQTLQETILGFAYGEKCLIADLSLCVRRRTDATRAVII